jgi:4'-phosphopantetheinyl transferase
MRQGIESAAEAWPTPPLDWRSDNSAVQLWFGRLDRSPDQMELLERALSADEKRRGRHFRFAQDRERYVVGRGLLRRLLGLYLDLDPADIRFGYAGHGKPFLSEPISDHALQFNLTHSGGLLLVAITRLDTVGVDVEWHGRARDIEFVSGQFLSQFEMMQLRELPTELRAAALLRIWICKEALLKAMGLGLSFAPSQIEISILSHGPARLLRISNSRRAAEHWSLSEVALASGFEAALVVPAWSATSPPPTRCWSMPF